MSQTNTSNHALDLLNRAKLYNAQEFENSEEKITRAMLEVTVEHSQKIAQLEVTNFDKLNEWFNKYSRFLFAVGGSSITLILTIIYHYFT